MRPRPPGAAGRRGRRFLLPELRSHSSSSAPRPMGSRPAESPRPNQMPPLGRGPETTRAPGPACDPGTRNRPPRVSTSAARRPAPDHLSSTLAPASSSFFLISSASAFGAPSFTALPPASTSSLASFRPRPVMARTSLMTLIFLSPASTLQDDVELGLLFLGSARRGRPPAGRRHRGHHHAAARRRLDAPVVLEHLRELSHLEHGEVREVFLDLLQIGHCSVSLALNRCVGSYPACRVVSATRSPSPLARFQLRRPPRSAWPRRP